MFHGRKEFSYMLYDTNNRKIKSMRKGELLRNS